MNLSPLAALFAALSIAGAHAQTPAPREVLGLMEKVADWQILHPSSYPNDDWTEGVGDAGFMALVGVSGKTDYRDAMLRVGSKNRWKLGPATWHADDHVVGQTYAELYQMQREPRMIAAMRAQFDAIIQDPKDDTLDFNAPGVFLRWTWCDALFMSPPTWARLAHLTGDTRYLEFAIERWWKTSDYLYDKDEHLYFRDSRYFDKREANGKKVFWGRGNGWVMGGLVRMLQYIPDNHPGRARFVEQFREMSERLLQLQQADGLWRASLLDPASYPSRESSGTGLNTYALAWGVNQGLLPKDRFAPAVQRAWAALAANVEADGKLVHVQPIGADPRQFDPSSTNIFAVGAFLMAGSEVYRMGLEEGGAPRVATVRNDSALHRAEESLVLPGATADMAVMDAITSRMLPTQATDKGLLIQADFAPGETRRFLLFPRSRLPALPPVTSRAHARFVPERLDDFAWENDRIGHRVYGPAIMTDPKEMLVSSGVDVWVKSAHRLVLEGWYRGGDYHADRGEGLDNYEVGRTRGCGGLGVFDGKVLHVSKNFSSWKVLSDGPLRTEFELQFDAWDAAGRKIAETRRITLDAGSNFSRVESRFSNNRPVTIGVGMVQREGQGSYRDKAGSWMSYWEPVKGKNGSNACAILLPGASGFTENAGHYLALAPAKPGQPFVYHLGAGWSKSGDFANAAAWDAYVAHTAERLAHPLTVTLSN